MKRVVFSAFLSAFFVLSCGSGDSGSKGESAQGGNSLSELVGGHTNGLGGTMWDLVHTNYTYGIHFETNGKFTLQVYRLSGQIYQVMAARGTYEVDRNIVQIKRLSTTCPQATTRLSSATFDLNEGRLTLSTRDGVVVLKRSFVRQLNPGDVITFGCLGVNGFHPHPWVDL